MKGVTEIEQGTLFGDKNLSDMLVEFYLITGELLNRSQITPNMLTEKEKKLFEEAGQTSMKLIDKLDGGVENEEA